MELFCELFLALIDDLMLMFESSCALDVFIFIAQIACKLKTFFNFHSSGRGGRSL